MDTIHVCGNYGLGQVFPTPFLPSPTWALVLCYPNTSVKPDVTLASASPKQVLPQYLLVQDLDQDFWALTQCYLNTGPTKTAGSLPPSWCLWWGKAGTASPDGRHHQFQLWWVCHPVVLFWVIPKIIGGFRVLAPFILISKIVWKTAVASYVWKLEIKCGTWTHRHTFQIPNNTGKKYRESLSKHW